MTSTYKGATKPLEKVYQEASQWVRLVNTIIWSMGTLLVPVSFGLLGVALNKSAGFQFDWRGKTILGVGSIFLFAFWVYASRIYKQSVQVARRVLIEIEKDWVDEKSMKESMSLYREQQLILDEPVRFFRPKTYDLFHSQKITLAALILVWALILCLRL